MLVQSLIPVFLYTLVEIYIAVRIYGIVKPRNTFPNMMVLASVVSMLALFYFGSLYAYANGLRDWPNLPDRFVFWFSKITYWSVLYSMVATFITAAIALVVCVAEYYIRWSRKA